MVQHFGAELRQGLVALIEKTNVFNTLREERQIATRRRMANQRQDTYVSGSQALDDWFQ